MKELTAPILGISLVLTSVFLPSAFISGITGQLFRQFALTITISVNISAIVALTLTPALCALIIKKRTKLWGPLGWFIDRFNGAFAVVTSGYMAVLRWLMRRVVLVIGLLAAFYVLRALLKDETAARRLGSCLTRTKASFTPWSSFRTARRSIATPRSSGESKATCRR